MLMLLPSFTSRAGSWHAFTCNLGVFLNQQKVRWWSGKDYTSGNHLNTYMSFKPQLQYRTIAFLQSVLLPNMSTVSDTTLTRGAVTQCSILWIFFPESYLKLDITNSCEWRQGSCSQTAACDGQCPYWHVVWSPLWRKSTVVKIFNI